MNVLRSAIVALLVAAPALAAQQDARLSARLDKPTFLSVRAIIDSARTAKLPTGPLYDKALEGAAKGSDDSKIVAAVRGLSSRMTVSKRVLGSGTSPDEIRAASTALDAGVSARDLARLRSASGKRPVTMSLDVLTDLIGRSVPVNTATNLVVQLARSRVRDQDLTIFQRNVHSDIEHGADPTVAAQTRARGLVLRHAAPPKPSA